MPIHSIRRTLFASTLAAVASTSMAQGIPAKDEPLPIIRPGHFSQSVDPAPAMSPRQQSNTVPASPPAVPPAATQAAPPTDALPQSTGWRASRSALAISSPRATAAPAIPAGSSDSPIELSENEWNDTSPAVRVRVLAAESLARGDSTTAAAILAGGVKHFPVDVRLAISLARVREAGQDWKGAVAAYDAVVRLKPAESRWKLRRAECQYQLGNYKAALDDYAAADAGTAEFTTAEYARFGDAALRTGDAAMAERAFTAISKLEPEPLAQVELLRAISVLRQGHAERAKNILIQATAAFPNDARLSDALRVATKLQASLTPAPTPAVATAAANDTMANRAPIVETSATVAAAPSSIGWRATKKKSAIVPARRPAKPSGLTTADGVTSAAVETTNSVRSPEPLKFAEPAPAMAEPAPFSYTEEPAILEVPEEEIRLLP